MKVGDGSDNLAIAWEYPGQVLEVIPASFSRLKRTCDMNPSCGAILDTWTGISGTSIADLRGGTNDLTDVPIKSTRLTDLLESPSNIGKYFGSRMKGWLLPPETGYYVFWIASDDKGEFWLSTDSNPVNKVRVCYTPGAVSRRFFTAYSEQKSNPISLVAGQAYYYEVRERAIFNSHLSFGVLTFIYF
jgi:hypothetical protein